ncbi:MAG: maltose ABC transporter substrate-binding protein [Treponema sp.]|jgi:arabinogalactan oligomer/maltooligosaccharide transport system substrate-binding protein|nr:maltose ABC transporter substrate-binding protein [Treponema sp.]
MKKIIPGGIFLLAAILVVFSGCLGRGGGAAQGSGGVSGSLMVWLDNDAWAERAISAFTGLYPDVTVEYENVGSVDTRGKVSLDGPAGIGPDVFIMPHDHIGIAILDGITEPFPFELQDKYRELLLDAALETCTSEGDLYGVPVSTENIALFYNKDLLGGEPPPESFEAIQRFAERYNRPQENRYALRWQVDDSYTNYFFLTAFGMQLFGPDMDDFAVPGWDSEAARRGVEFHHSFRRYFNVKVADATYDATIGAFQRGNVPFTICGPWGIEDAVKNGVNFGITKLPTINGQQPRCFSGNIVVVVSSYSRNIDTAFAFTDFLVSLEGETILYETTGKMAAYKDISVIPGLRDDEYMKGIQEQAPYSDPMPIIPEMAQAWDAQKALFTFTWDEQLSIPQAQQKAMETYDTALAIAGKSR